MSANRKENTRKKKRRPKNSQRQILKKTLRFLPFLAPLLLTAFLYAWLYTRMNIVGLPIEELRDTKRNLIKQNESIHLRIEQLQAPARIESIARNKLGMVSLEKWQVVALDEPLQPPDEEAPEQRGRASENPSSQKHSSACDVAHEPGVAGSS